MNHSCSVQQHDNTQNMDILTVMRENDSTFDSTGELDICT